MIKTRQTNRKNDIHALAEMFAVGWVGFAAEDEEDDEPPLLLLDEGREDDEDEDAAAFFGSEDDELEGFVEEDEEEEGLAPEEDEAALGSDGMTRGAQRVMGLMDLKRGEEGLIGMGTG